MVKKLGIYDVIAGHEVINVIVPLADDAFQIYPIPDPILQASINSLEPLVGSQFFTQSGIVSTVSKYNLTSGWTQLIRLRACPKTLDWPRITPND